MVNLDIDVSFKEFKESPKQYLLNNVLIIKYKKSTVLGETLILLFAR